MVFKQTDQPRNNKENTGGTASQEAERILGRNLDDTLSAIRQSLGNSPDVIVRPVQIGAVPGVRVAVIYIEGLSSKLYVNRFLSQSLGEDNPDSNDNDRIFETILAKASSTLGNLKVLNDWDGMIHSLLSGHIVILMDGRSGAVIADIRDGEWRSISEPTTELTVRGPKDSFIESIDTNIALVRRRLKNPNLRLETMTIGNESKTDVAIMYINGVTNDRLVSEVKQRLSAIEVDAIQGSGYLEELIRDQTFTPFPTIFNTERPDMAVGNMLEGRIALIVDGTPFTLIMPTTFSQFLKTTEDYYQRFYFAVFLRFVRYFSFFVLLLLPSSYIAVTTFHHEMIPTSLIINLLAQREGIPFPAYFEAMLMEISFEIMREAGIRMPRAVGQAVSIVGAIVLGTAAVEAGVVTAMMVIIVSLTGIASFAIPGLPLNNAVRVIRFPMMILASTFGFYGIMMGMIFLVAHMTSLKSFGVPYLYPFSPFDPWRQKDTFWRSPIKTSRTRPDLKEKAGESPDVPEGERHES
ncbi:spore germination protein [Cohnella suwonensis]|uniref:Spore germination protein n=1 Tax=Cohnella suwonensis TaxID=696072 RepID=A0ABW0LRS3_9BACL